MSAIKEWAWKKKVLIAQYDMKNKKWMIEWKDNDFFEMSAWARYKTWGKLQTPGADPGYVKRGAEIQKGGAGWLI